MNISDCVNDIKTTLGLNTIALPFNEPIETVIQNILKTSIRTFSRFKPLVKECYIKRSDLKESYDGSGRLGIYVLPASMTTTDVFEAYATVVDNSFLNTQTNSDAFSTGVPFIGFGSYYPQDMMNAVMTGAAINKYLGVTVVEPTSRWLGHNTFQLYNTPQDATLYIEVKCQHDLTGETIEESLVESFMKLATLDVERTLYNNLKNMNNVGSAFKEIQLKIDDWSGAQQQRDELVQQWTASFHLDEIEDLVQFF